MNTSPPPPPLTSIVSLPAPPSLVSSPSPGFQTSVSSPSPPTELSRVPGSLLSPRMRSLPAPPVIVSGSSPPSRVSLPSPPSMSSAKPTPVVDVMASSPPLALRSSRSAVPMSRLNGPGGVGPVRSNAIRPAVAEGATVNTSPPPPPLTSIVSVSEPPSLVSSPSPGFQTSVSRPEPPTARSRVPAGLLSPMMRSSSSPPSRLSSMSLPVIVSLPAPPSTSTSVTLGYTAPGLTTVTPTREITFVPGPPVTSIAVMLAQVAAGPGLGAAPLTCTAPPAQVIAIPSAAVLVTVRRPPAVVDVIAALATPGKASSASVADTASRAAVREFEAERDMRMVHDLPDRRALGGNCSLRLDPTCSCVESPVRSYTRAGSDGSTGVAGLVTGAAAGCAVTGALPRVRQRARHPLLLLAQSSTRRAEPSHCRVQAKAQAPPATQAAVAPLSCTQRSSPTACCSFPQSGPRLAHGPAYGRPTLGVSTSYCQRSSAVRSSSRPRPSWS